METWERHKGTLISLNFHFILLSMGYCQALLCFHTQCFTLKKYIQVLNERFITFTSFVFLSRGLLQFTAYRMLSETCYFTSCSFLNHLIWVNYCRSCYSISARHETFRLGVLFFFFFCFTGSLLLHMGFSSCSKQRLLIAVTFLVVEHRL